MRTVFWPVFWRCVAVLVFLSPTAAALAQSGRAYIALDGGAVMVQDKRSSMPGTGIDIKYDFNLGMAISPVVGWRSDDGLLLETELKYLRFSGKVRTGSASVPFTGNMLAPMLNIGYEPELAGPFTAYVKAGAGYGHMWGTATNVVPHAGSSFLYQGILGLAYQPVPESRFSLEYKHMRSGARSAMAAHQFNLGYTHKFGGAPRQQQ